MVEESLRKILDAQPWGELLDRVTLYAGKKLRQRFWQGEFGGTPPGGMEASDFVMTAVCKVYSGERRWDPEKDKCMLGFLCDVVDSLIYNARKSVENQQSRHIDEATEQIAAPAAVSSADDFVLGFYEFVAEDPELCKVVECILEGCLKPEDIAHQLGLSSEAVYNLKKRFARKLTEFRAQVYGTQMRRESTYGG